MTIVATSMPVLRVFFKQAVNTAISNYHNSSSRIKSKSSASNPGSSTESLVEDLERGGCELEDLVVDEKTGRVTMKTPDSMPDGDKHHAHWPL
jgi:hypothetical protein